jgi:hypothetical protein
MMATTISSSISEKPFCFRISIFSQALCFEFSSLDDSYAIHVALARPSSPVTLVRTAPQQGVVRTSGQKLNSILILPRLD